MLKNLALASVIALADAVKLECCPVTSCCADDDAADEDFEEAVAEEVEDQIEVLEGGVEAELEQEA